MRTIDVSLLLGAWEMTVAGALMVVKSHKLVTQHKQLQSTSRLMYACLKSCHFTGSFRVMIILLTAPDSRQNVYYTINSAVDQRAIFISLYYSKS